MQSLSVPDIIVGRLPLYLRALSHMISEGQEITSSQDLGERLGISSAQIRKDLSQFGEFGKQGTGYNISFLIDQLRKILHVDRIWDVVLVGAGDLGRAVANYRGFLERGFRIIGVYDNDPKKVGQPIGDFVIEEPSRMMEKIRQDRIEIAMLAVPSAAAQEAAENLVEAGVRAILCYAPTSLKVPKDVRVQYIDPVLHLQRMTYYVP
ncbi:MAG: redox-sensing transcriptional repressor Rex [Chloroflexi bacterium]|nr:redox-sensing transcriptional repressor Rex [Chloroflexota bacterium]